MNILPMVKQPNPKMSTGQFDKKSASYFLLILQVSQFIKVCPQAVLNV